MSGGEGKEDKYEQLLAKIDWRAPHPPKGYHFGAGRGAKGFVTTAELTTVGATGAKLTREENDFFSAMERMEERGTAHKKGRPDRGDAHKEQEGGTATKVKLSLDDLATLEQPSASAAPKVVRTSADNSSATAASSHDTAAAAEQPSLSAPASSLVVRSARTEEGDAAEEHIFADERVLTPYDVLKGKASAAQAGLHNVLSMGSTEDQTTWITHARAYREMGMTRRAYQTLVEGCAVTGKKGKRIWEERLRYLAKDNVAGRRRLLEEATAACPGEEELWTQLLEVVPPLERVPCLQRAVLACSASEQLWLRLVQLVPSAQDQRVLLQRALQHTPHLPLLWARLARLESYKTGKEMFQAAAARFPSLALIIEAAKYVEWYTLSRWVSEVSSRALRVSKAAPAAETNVAKREEDGAAVSDATSQEEALRLYHTLRTASSDIDEVVRTAQQNYLNLGEVGSRHAWLSMALSLLHSESTEAAVPTATTGSDEVGVLRPSVSGLSRASVYVCTAAYMFLCVVDPNHKGLGAGAVPATWLSDLTALFPAEAAAQHEVRCALWCTWVLLQQDYLDHVVAARGSGIDGTSSGSSPSSPLLPSLAAAMKASLAGAQESIANLEGAILSAPLITAQTELPWLLNCASHPSAADEQTEELDLLDGRRIQRMPEKLQWEDRKAEPEVKKEEELGKPAAAAAAAAPYASPSASRPLSLPSPLLLTVGITLGLATRAALLVRASETTPLPAASLQQGFNAALETIVIDVPLTLSEALDRRGFPTAALAVVELVLSLSSSATASDGVLNSATNSSASSPLESAAPADLQPQLQRQHRLSSELRLHVARAKLLAAVGDNAAADRCLLEAVNATASQSNISPALQEETWVKLSVLRRSQGQPIEGVLQDGLRQCPRSWRLWLMLLEEKRRSIDAHQQRLSDSLANTKAHVTTVDVRRLDETLVASIRDIRGLCKTALSSDHCRATAAVWIFAAQRIEAELLQNVPAARALLTDAVSACAPAVSSTRAQLLARSASPQEIERQASALAQLGVAQARLEAQYGAPGQALETVQEVLQRLPKTRDGALAMTHEDDAVGELLGLFVTLEPPASRGRAAAQVMRQLKSREPLALCAVAQLYYAAGQYARALDQAVKAVQVSRGRCGDAVGLLWRMADQPVMQPFVKRLLYGSKADEEEDGAGHEGGSGAAGNESGSAVAADGAPNEDLTPETVQRWVLSVMTMSAASGGSGEEKRAVGAAAAAAVPLSAAWVVPRGGPLWIAVAKAQDPTNVGLRGYRRPVVEMLREVANRIELKGPGSATGAAPLR